MAGGLHSADLGVLLLTVGLLLIYLELNRPGLVLPGAVGLLAALLGLARLLRAPIVAPAGVSLLVGLALLGVSAWAVRRVVIAVVSTGALLYGLCCVAAPPLRPHTAVVLPCALLLGVGTSLLTTVAARARQNKGLDLTRKAPRAPGAPPF